MAYSVEKTAKTTQEAISLALIELKVDESRVKVEILDEGNKGIFGLIGNKMAKVKVTVNESSGDKARDFILSVLEKMQIDAEIEMIEDEDSLQLR